MPVVDVSNIVEKPQMTMVTVHCQRHIAPHNSVRFKHFLQQESAVRLFVATQMLSNNNSVFHTVIRIPLI
jgi:hypothetical protein